jgi:hypothetical protein
MSVIPSLRASSRLLAVCLAAQDDDRQTGHPAADLSQGADPAQAGHHDVQEHRARRVGEEPSSPSLPANATVGLVALMGQRLGHEAGHRRLVLDDENPHRGLLSPMRHTVTLSCGQFELCVRTFPPAYGQDVSGALDSRDQ